MVERSMNKFEIDDVLDKFKKIELSRLQAEVEKATDNGRYCLVIDANKNASVFFSYKANLKEFHKECLAVQLNHKSKEDALETLRKGIVQAMRFGTSFVIDVDRIVPNFNTEWTSKETFPAAEICDFDSWRLRKNYMKVVRPEEDHDVTGNPKGYVM